uniref:Putative secreted protein n=1 Tax=Anopheles marajoara TaxID=58244 RepID=A0A2M4CB70_9DIPT
MLRHEPFTLLLLSTGLHRQSFAGLSRDTETNRTYAHRSLSAIALRSVQRVSQRERPCRVLVPGRVHRYTAGLPARVYRQLGVCPR